MKLTQKHWLIISGIISILLFVVVMIANAEEPDVVTCKICCNSDCTEVTHSAEKIDGQVMTALMNSVNGGRSCNFDFVCKGNAGQMKGTIKLNKEKTK